MRSLCGIVLFAGLSAAQDPLSAELAKAVDLETPSQRRKAALELAGRKDVTLDQWIAAARAFGTFKAMPTGPKNYIVSLRVLRAVEKTKITVYLPAKYRPERPAPLMIASHSTALLGASAYPQWRGVAERLGIILLCPWGRPNTAYGFTERERESTLAALRWARRRYHVDENRICLSGWGRGGHLSWDLALRRRDRFAALAAIWGAPTMVTSNGANNLRYLENVVDLPIRCLVGRRGPSARMADTVPPVFQRLSGWGAPNAKLIRKERGGFREVDWDKFLAIPRDPRPTRIVRAYARRGEGRAFWVEILTASSKAKENFRLVATPEEAKGLDDKGYLLFMQRKAEERTARLEVERDGAGGFVAAGKYVRKFRLLLDASMFTAGKDVRVVFNGKEFRRTPRPSAAILLKEFVERFDRTFLPVAELRIP